MQVHHTYIHVYPTYACVPHTNKSSKNYFKRSLEVSSFPLFPSLSYSPSSFLHLFVETEAWPVLQSTLELNNRYSKLSWNPWLSSFSLPSVGFIVWTTTTQLCNPSLGKVSFSILRRLFKFAFFLFPFLIFIWWEIRKTGEIRCQYFAYLEYC